jgi:hypothetical protein
MISRVGSKFHYAPARPVFSFAWAVENIEPTGQPRRFPRIDPLKADRCSHSVIPASSNCQEVHAYKFPYEFRIFGHFPALRENGRDNALPSGFAGRGRACSTGIHNRISLSISVISQEFGASRK